MKKILGVGGYGLYEICWLQWLTDEENIFHFKSSKMARKT